MSTGDRGAWHVVLVVEDDTDGKALDRLIQASEIPVVLDWLPANGIGNIKRKGPALIRLARDRIVAGRGCVAVLVDRDGRDAGRDEPHKSIAEACRAADIPYIEVVEAFEAWCLADDGIVGWPRHQTGAPNGPDPGPEADRCEGLPQEDQAVLSQAEGPRPARREGHRHEQAFGLLEAGHGARGQVYPEGEAMRTGLRWVLGEL